MPLTQCCAYGLCGAWRLLCYGFPRRREFGKVPPYAFRVHARFGRVRTVRHAEKGEVAKGLGTSSRSVRLLAWLGSWLTEKGGVAKGLGTPSRFVWFVRSLARTVAARIVRWQSVACRQILRAMKASFANSGCFRCFLVAILCFNCFPVITVAFTDV